VVLFRLLVFSSRRYGLESTAYPPRKYVFFSEIISFFLSIQLAEALLTSPGTIHEISTTLVDGKLQRVYKNLWPSLRQFWLSAVSRYAEDTYIVFEQERLTYNQVHGRSLKLASLLSKVYDVQKGKELLAKVTKKKKNLTIFVGDRVAICSRNSPEYLVAFWACRMLDFIPFLSKRTYS